VSELMTKMAQLTALLTPAEEGGYVILNPETGTASQGDTIAQAFANLGEAVEIYFEEFPPEMPSC
jgi:predicted RNase H-like HicB family nuclease